MASPGQYNPLPDEDLSALADSMGFSDTRPLGKTLGLGDVDLDRIHRENPRPAYTILIQWKREQFLQGEALRILLGKKLAEAGLMQLSIRLLSGEFSTCVTPAPGLASSKGLSDDFLISLADGIEQDKHADSLGRALGFSNRKLTDFQETNYMSGRKTSKGTEDMLFEWRQKVSPNDQHGVMREALLKAGLRYLADLHFGTKPNILYVQITPTMNFQYCIDIVRNHYKTVLCHVQRRPWDPNDYIKFDRLYTELHLLQYDRSTGEMRSIPFGGTVNQIMSLKVEGEPWKRLLLLAPGGYGKTCAIAKLAYDWAYEVEGSPMKDIPALFALQLRKVDDDMGLGEAIISQLLGIIPGVTAEKLEEIIGLHEKECALLCDGYDEYTKSIRETKSKNSLVQTLQHKRLKNCQVLVTSRPFLEDDFLQRNLSRVYVKIEGKGFTPQLAHQFIHRYFEARSTPEEEEHLNMFLRANRFLGELIAVPFFCTMICHLHEVNALSEANTRSSLFRNLNIFLLHHAKAKDMVISSEGHHLDNILHALGQVALSGLLQESRKFVFEERDFKDCPDAYEKGLMLGILSKIPTPVKHVDHEALSRTSVEFFHIWEQEYCASVFLQHHTPATNRFATLPKKIMKPLSSFPSVRGKTASSFQERMDLQTLLNTASSPQKTIVFENMIRLLAGSKNFQICQEIFSHINRLDWRCAVQDQGYTHSDKCRVILHCVSEADTVYLTGKVAHAISNCFREGRLSLENITASMIRGIRSLPTDTKMRFTTAEITKSCLTPRLLDSLAGCERLSSLDVRDIASVEGSPQERLPQFSSIKKLSVSWVEPKVLRTLSRCMPAVEEAEVRMRLDGDAVEEDMSAIIEAVGVMGATLKTLTIFAASDLGSVSTESGQEFGRVLVAGHLETLIVWFLHMSETVLIDIIKSCQQASRIKLVRFLKCRPVKRNGDACKLLDGLAGKGAPTRRTARRITVQVNDDSWIIPHALQASTI